MEPQDIGNFNFRYVGRLNLGARATQVLDNWHNPITYLNCFTYSFCDDQMDIII